ncbi:MAG: hypothetical protein NW208_19355 [Bryobacter sp.]|nr:hypothetical protein [Bryobacter sp.]
MKGIRIIWLLLGLNGVVAAQTGASAGDPGGGQASGVDLAWKVLPFNAVQDAFGRRVADRYFAIEIHVGNNSGHDLLLSGFFFRPPKLDDGRTGHAQALEPNDPYSLVRSTIEREQQIGRRAMTMHIVRSFGPLLSLGGTLISGSAVTLAKYGSGVGIFSNGIEKGLDNAYPDQTLRQISRLDANSFQDNLVLRQNEPRRVLVFVGREAVQCPKGEKGNCDGMLPWTRQFVPGQVKERLGVLSLHGHQLAYTRRIRVEAGAEGEQSQ